MPVPARNLATTPGSKPLSALHLSAGGAALAGLSPRNTTAAAAKEFLRPLAFLPQPGGRANSAVRFEGRPGDVPSTPRQVFDRLATIL